MQSVLKINKLAEKPLDAAAAFHADWLPQARERLFVSGMTSLVLEFRPADHAHRQWRAAAVAELAREAAPTRVNAIVGATGMEMTATLAWLGEADGVTGQIFALAPAAENAGMPPA